MASSIDAITSGAGGIVTTADNSGILQLKSAGTTIATISSTGLQQNVGAPAFSAYLAATQTITTGTFTKLQINTEEWDTNNNFDTSNYRFTPTVAGYYQVNGRLNTSVNSTLLIITIYKNGGEHRRGGDLRASMNAATGVNVSSLVYMNGTTDYLELYGYITGTTPGVEGGSGTTSYFQASLARSA